MGKESQNGALVSRGEENNVKKSFKTKEIDWMFEVSDVDLRCEMTLEDYKLFFRTRNLIVRCKIVYHSGRIYWILYGKDAVQLVTCLNLDDFKPTKTLFLE